MSLIAIFSAWTTPSSLRSNRTASHCITAVGPVPTKSTTRLRILLMLGLLCLLMPAERALAVTAAVAPTFSPVAGKYYDVQTITLSDATTGASIYYTTDGTTPTTASTLYSAPFTISTSKTVKAIAVASGYSQSSVGQAAYTLMTAVPVNSPTSGLFTSAQTISLTDTTPGAVIYYTTDGTTPTVASPVYKTPFTLSQNTLVQAIAQSNGFALSTVLSKSYNFQAVAPVLSPVGGSYSAAQTVAMSTTTPGASVYYTTDGTTPTSASNLYAAPVTVSVNEKVMAIALSSNYSKSSVTSATYSFITATPVLSLAAGKYTSVQSVAITDATAGATIYYTMDGSTPTSASAVYSGPITVSSTETFSAAAQLPNWTLSKVVKAAYTIQLPVAVPVLSLASGTYNTIQTVSISDTTTGATIYYTTNGSYPTTSSAVYSAPLTVTGNMTVQAIAVYAGQVSSGAAVGTYSIVVPTPTILPAQATVNYTATVTMSNALSGSTIYYTTDGSTPSTASTVYTAPIVLKPSVTTTTQFAAMAVASGYLQSSLTTASVTVTLPTGTLAEATISTTPSLTIPKNFLGISTDWTQPTAMMGQASTGVNTAFRQLLSNLTQYYTAPMLMRITGDNSTLSNLQPDAQPLLELSQALNIHYALGVDLMNNNLSVAQAQAVQWLSLIPASVIDAIEIGNEPDNYIGQNKRVAPYAFTDYLVDFQAWQQGIQNVVGSGVGIMGPSTAGSSWNAGATAGFQAGTFLPTIVSQHAYLSPATATFTPPADYLLLPASATSLPAGYAPYAAAAHKAGLIFRMGEINSVCGGGAAGISDTFQSTLWSIDIMFNYLAAGVDGVNWHTGQYTRYSLFQFKPQPSGSKVVYNLTTVTPLYYGVLTFAQMAGRNAKLLPVSAMSDANVSIWATVDSTSAAHVVVINKDEVASGSVQISLPGYSTGTVRAITAPSFTSTTGVTLGGQTFDGSTDGTIQGSAVSTTIQAVNGVFTLANVPVTSAVLIDFAK